MIIRGGLGDDTFRQGAESAATNAAGTQNLSLQTILYGDEGNDKFEKFIGSGRATESIGIFGGDGDDKISGGSGFSSVRLYGYGGNDIVYGFD